MSEYKDRFDKWQREAKEKLGDIDRQLGISERLEEGVKTAADTVSKGTERLRKEAEKSEAGRNAVRAAEETLKGAESAARKAWDVSAPLRDAAEDVGEAAGEAVKQAGKAARDAAGEAGEKASKAFDDARESVGKNAKRVSDAVNFGASWARTVDSAWKTLSNATDWVTKEPLSAAATGVSVAVGAGIGAVLTGVSSHWFFSSAIPAWSVKTLAGQFDSYLKRQEELIARGDLTFAEAERIRFERDIAKWFGAPLLGGFSFASGVVLMTNVLNPRTVTGAPIDWLLGGNPVLEGVWFFGNGVVCFKTSYDLFMIALDDSEDVQRMVREIKGLLPSPA